MSQLAFLLMVVSSLLPVLSISLLTAVVLHPCHLARHYMLAIHVQGLVPAISRELHSIDKTWLSQGADALERAHSLKTIVFDKTGTLTKGTPSVVDLQLFPAQVSLDEMLHLAAAAEAGSEHPIGRAVLRYARSQLCGDLGACRHSCCFRPGSAA